MAKKYGTLLSETPMYYDCKIIVKKYLNYHVSVKIAKCIIFIFMKVQINILHTIVEVIQFDSLFLTRLRLLYGGLWGVAPKSENSRSHIWEVQTYLSIYQNWKFKELYLQVCSRSVLALCSGEASVLRMNSVSSVINDLIY